MMLSLPLAHELQLPIKERLTARIADAPGIPIARLHPEIPVLPEDDQERDCLLVGKTERAPLLIAAQIGDTEPLDGLRVPPQTHPAQCGSPEENGDVVGAPS